MACAADCILFFVGAGVWCLATHDPYCKPLPKPINRQVYCWAAFSHQCAQALTSLDHARNISLRQSWAPKYSALHSFGEL